MPINFGKAHQTDRGRHPDLDDNGELRDDVDVPTRQREFNRMWQDDAQRTAFMYRVALEQSQLPPDIQEAVAGQTYGAGRDPYSGFQEYLSDIERMRRVPGNPQRDFTGADISKMSLQEFDAAFDERGQPREGITFHATGRDVDLSHREGIDPFSQRELRNR